MTVTIGSPSTPITLATNNPDSITVYPTYLTLVTHSEGSSGGTVDDGAVIDNTMGDVVAIQAQLVSTANGGGSSPTQQLVLKGSLDGTYFASLTDGTNIIDTTADGISSAGTTPVSTFLDTQDFPARKSFPAKLRVDAVIGGTSTPTIAAGTVQVRVLRKGRMPNPV